jgi:hypothetical protein
MAKFLTAFFGSLASRLPGDSNIPNLVRVEFPPHSDRAGKKPECCRNLHGVP